MFWGGMFGKEFRKDKKICWIKWIYKGKKLFKVYVGPYKTQAEVEAVFPKIKERVADAHIYSEDADLLEMYRQQKQVYTAE